MRTAVKQSLIAQEKINHVVFVLDRSGTMQPHTAEVIKTLDRQVATLAKLSQEKGQETRVTIIMFDYEVEVLVYDKDVLRLPSIANVYRTRRGRTALLDATMVAIDDLAKIPHLYGSHANMLISVTDGLDNESDTSPSALRAKVASLGENWTLVTFVPDAYSEEQAIGHGFPAGNIRRWDVEAKDGFTRAAQEMEQATERWMTNRTRGINGSKSMFTMDATALNADSIRAAGLRVLDEDSCTLVRVAAGEPEEYPKIRDWVEGAARHRFKAGNVYQELVKKTEVQATKKLVVVDNGTDRVYGGTQAQVRSLLGLGEDNTKIEPQANRKYSVFVQSKSTNRKPVVGQRMLLMKD